MEGITVQLRENRIDRSTVFDILANERRRTTLECLTTAGGSVDISDLATDVATWSEYYRTLAIVALTIIVAALAEVPLVSAIDSLLWGSLFLAIFAVSTAFQLWSNRWDHARFLNGRR